MIKFGALRGRRRRAHLRMLRRVSTRGTVYVRKEPHFRMLQRLHQAGLVTACVSRWNLMGDYTGRPFRELAVFSSESVALMNYPRALPRRSP